MISNNKYQPTGNKNVGYPQICIRTNRTAERTDIKPLIEKAISIGQQFPFSEKYKIIYEVNKALGSAFGSGQFGHVWIIYFHSEKANDNISYAFHEGYGFVKNYDSPERKFHLQRCVKVDGVTITPELIEEKIIPKLISQSNELSQLMKLTTENMKDGVYTPITNCAWFAGNLWHQAMKLTFEQALDGYINIDELADKMGLPFIKNIRSIGDHGMLAESIENGINVL